MKIRYHLLIVVFATSIILYEVIFHWSIIYHPYMITLLWICSIVSGYHFAAGISKSIIRMIHWYTGRKQRLNLTK